MEENEKRILLDVVVKAKDSLKRTNELRAAIGKLSTAQSELDVTTKEGARQHAAMEAAIKAYSKAANEAAKVTEKEVAQMIEKEGSIKALKAELNNLQAGYESLSDAERAGVKGEGFRAKMEAVNAAIKDTGGALGEVRGQIGAYITSAAAFMNTNEAFTDGAKKASEMRASVARLKEEQKNLDTSTKEGKEAYEVAEATIRAYNREMRASVKIAENEITLNNNKEGSLQQLKAQLSNLTAEYNSLSRAERDNEEIGGALAVSINEITDELKAAESGVQNYRRNVGNYEKSVSNALAGNNSFVASIIESVGASDSAGEALAGVTQQTAGFSKSLLKLLANPIIFFIAAITAAVMLLVKAFNRSEEQGEALGGMMAKISGVFNALLKALEPVAAFLVDGVVAAFDMLSSAISTVMDGVAAFLDFFGMETAAAWVKDTKGAVEEMAAASSELYKSERELVKISRDLKKERSDLKRQAMELNQASKDGTKTLGERIQLSKQYYGALVKQQEAELTEARKALEVALLRLKVEGETTEALDAKADALARIADIELGIATEMANQKNEEAQLIKDAADKAREDAEKRIEAEKRSAIAITNIRSAQNADTLENRESTARRLLQIEQNAATESLNLQRAAGKLSNAEYKAAMDDMAAARVAFNNESSKRALDFTKSQTAAIMGLLRDTTSMQITEIERSYSEAMDNLANLQPPAFSPNMKPGEYDAAVDEYESLMLERSAIATELESEKDRRIAELRKAARDAEIAEIETNTAEAFANELARYSDNEAAKLEITKAKLHEQIEAKRAAGLETYSEEAQLRATESQQNAANLNAQLLTDTANAKARYDAKKAYLLKEAELYKDNADKQAAVAFDLAELDKELVADRIEALNEWRGHITDVMGAFAGLASAISANNLEELRAENEQKKEELQSQLDDNLITREEFDAETAKLDEDMKKKQAKAARKQAIQEKAMKVFNVVTDTAAGIAKAVSASPLTFGMPWSAFVGATGAAQLATILAAPLPKAARGGLIGGRPHSQGGTILEAERGEVIINKRSAKQYLPLLSEINKAGGGVAFTASTTGGYSAKQATRGAQAALTAQDVAKAMQGVNIAVAVEDIQRGQQKYTDVIDRARF